MTRRRSQKKNGSERKRGPKKSRGSGKDEQTRCPLPDFDLAPPLTAAPALIVRGEDDEIGIFMLALAAVFNDLKGADYARFQLGRYANIADWPLESRGQYRGLEDQGVRVIFGIAREGLALIEKNKALLDHEEMKAVVEALPTSTRESWDEIVQIALGADKLPERSNATSQLLVKMRNNLAFHYGARALMHGYLAHFGRSDPATYSDKIYVSLGENMEQTRFYYADAAYIAAVEKLTGMPIAEVQAKISGALRHMNQAIRGLLITFLRGRVGSSFPRLGDDSDVSSS